MNAVLGATVMLMLLALTVLEATRVPVKKDLLEIRRIVKVISIENTLSMIILTRTSES